MLNWEIHKHCPSGFPLAQSLAIANQKSTKMGLVFRVLVAWDKLTYPLKMMTLCNEIDYLALAKTGN